MRRIRCLVLILAFSLIGFPGRAEDANDELKALQGTWELVSFERDGQEVKPRPDTKAITTGNKFVIKVGDEVLAAGTFTLDPNTKPKSSETTYTEGRDKGKTFKGM